MIDCSASYSASQAARQWFGRLVYGIVAAGWMTGSAQAASESETITIKGNIQAECSFPTSPPNEVNFGNLSEAGSQKINFEINCNDKFKVEMTSAQGELKHETQKTAPDGFAITHPYKAFFEVKNDDGVSVGRKCTSPNMKKGRTCSEISSDVAAIGQDATVTFRLGKTPQKPLVAGTYKDTYTITVAIQGP
jgi:spore coat protein U-like protein